MTILIAGGTSIVGTRVVHFQAGVVMDTRDMTFDAAETMRRYPSVVPTRLAEVVRRGYRKDT